MEQSNFNNADSLVSVPSAADRVRARILLSEAPLLRRSQWSGGSNWKLPFKNMSWSVTQVGSNLSVLCLIDEIYILKKTPSLFADVCLKSNNVVNLSLSGYLLSKVMKKLCMEPPERLTSLQTLWDNNKPTEPGPCGRKLSVVNLWYLFIIIVTFYDVNHM